MMKDNHSVTAKASKILVLQSILNPLFRFFRASVAWLDTPAQFSVICSQAAQPCKKENNDPQQLVFSMKIWQNHYWTREYFDIFKLASRSKFYIIPNVLLFICELLWLYMFSMSVQGLRAKEKLLWSSAAWVRTPSCPTDFLYYANLCVSNCKSYIIMTICAACGACPKPRSVQNMDKDSLCERGQEQGHQASLQGTHLRYT